MSTSAQWLFDVTTSGGTNYYWGTAAGTYNSQSYTAKVKEFPGVTLNLNMSELGLHIPNKCKIQISNPSTSLTASDFEGGECIIRLSIPEVMKTSGGSIFEVLGGDDLYVEQGDQWRFYIKRAYNLYQVLHLELECFITKYLEGDYPNTKLVNDLFPSSALKTTDDNMCVPVPFGRAYIPTRPVNISGEVYYLLGPDSYDYDIDECRPPRESGLAEDPNPTLYTTVDFNLTQTITSSGGYKLYQPTVLSGGGVATYIEGGTVRDFLTKFGRSDTEDTRNPADVIKFVLEDLGIPSAYIDSSTFTDAWTTFDGWDLAWDGAFFYKQQRQKVLSQLLIQCNAYLRFTDVIELYVYSTSSVKTVTTSSVQQRSFSYQPYTRKTYDSLYVAYSEKPKPIDKLSKVLVAKESSTDVPASDTLVMPFVNTSQNAKKLGTLVCQRKYGKAGVVEFQGGEGCKNLRPGQVITINDNNYNGNYSALIERVTIRKDLSVRVQASYHSVTLDDWADLSLSSVSEEDADNTTPWKPVIQGPSSTPSSGSDPPDLSDTNHDSLPGFVSDEHINHSGVSISGGGLISGGGDLTQSRTLTLNNSDIDHDSLSNFNADEHIDWTQSQTENIHADNVVISSLDGDHLDIDWNPSNYTPDSSISEADDADDLSAHLKGIDDELGTGVSSTFTIVTAVQQDSAGTVEYKTRDLTFTNGKLTTLGTESGWTAA